MSHFSRDAIDMLRSAECALAGRRRKQADGVVAVAAPYLRLKGDGEYYESSSAAGAQDHTIELVRQLQLALNEIAVLKSEVAAEREARSQALVSLGKRWKEEVLVDVRGADFQIRRDLTALEQRVGEQLRDKCTNDALLKRQLEEVQRASKVRDTTQFERHEQLNDEIESLRQQVDAAKVQCTAVRVEAAQLLEKERASLSHRLDAEMLRFVDMRHEDQREMQKTREGVKDEVKKLGGTVDQLVKESWRTCATALEKSVRVSLESFTDELQQTKTTVRSMSEKVEDCVRTCQAESRLQTASLKDRIASLESTEAVLTSRVDRAEKKSDAAHDTSCRMDAAVLIAKESTEKALSVAQRAAERAQRMEDTLVDRDSRLVKLETDLHSIASAEKLTAEVEGCKRHVARVGSQMDGLSAVCARSEALSESTARQIAGVSERVAQCEKTSEKCSRLAQETVEEVHGLAGRVVSVEDMRSQLMESAERQSNATTRLEHRLDSTDNRVRLLTESYDQSRKDVQTQQQSLSVRLETTHELANRSESSSAIAKAVVERLEQRLVKVEASASTFVTETAALRADVEENTKEVSAIRGQNVQFKELQSSRESRLEDKLIAMDRLEGAVNEKVDKLERRVMKQLEMAGEQATGVAENMEANVQDSFTRFQKHVEGELARSFNDMQRKMRDVSMESRGVEAVEESVAEVHNMVKELERQFASAADVHAMRRTLAALESQLHSTQHEVNAQLEVMQDKRIESQNRMRQYDSELKRIRADMQSLHSDLTHHEEDIRTHERRIIELSEGHNSLVRRIIGAQEELHASHLLPAHEASRASTAGHNTTSTVIAPTTTRSSPSAKQPTAQDLPSTHHQQQQRPAIPLAQQQQARSNTSPSSRELSSRASSQRDQQQRHQLSGISSVKPASEYHSPGAHLSPESSLSRALGEDEQQSQQQQHAQPTAKRSLFDTPSSSQKSDTGAKEEEEEVKRVEVDQEEPSEDDHASEGSQHTDTVEVFRPDTDTAAAVTATATSAPQHSVEMSNTSAQQQQTGGGQNASQQSNTVHKFTAFDDSTTSESEAAAQPVAPRQDLNTDDITTSTPSATAPSGRREIKMASAWMKSSSSSSSNSVDLDAMTGEGPRSVRRDHSPPQTLEALIEAAESVSAHSRIHSAAASAHGGETEKGTYDDWDASDDDDEDAVERFDDDGDDAHHSEASSHEIDNVGDEDEASQYSDGDDVDADAVIPMHGDTTLSTQHHEEEEEEGDESEDLATEEDDEDAVIPMHDNRDLNTPEQRSDVSTSGDEDAVMPMNSSPQPRAVQQDSLLHATPRKAFVNPDDEGPLMNEEVPRHGRATTSSSSSGERPSVEQQQRQPPIQLRPTVRKYNAFDDTSSDEG